MANMDYTAMLRNLDLYRPKQPYQGLQNQPQPGAPQPYSGFGMGHHPMGGGYMQNLQQLIRQKDQPWHNGSMQAPGVAPGATPPAAPVPQPARNPLMKGRGGF
jgi:hypothetical protein